MLSNVVRSRLVMSWLIVCAAFAGPTFSQSIGEVIFTEGFEANNLNNWSFVYSTDGSQSGSIDPPGNWNTEVVGEALIGEFSARLTADCIKHGVGDGPYNVRAAINRTVGPAGYLSVRLKFDSIQGSGGNGASWFQVAALSAADTSKFISYGFSTTADLAGDTKYSVCPGEELNFKADLAEDYRAKYQEEIPDDMILRFMSHADFADQGSGRRTTIVRVDQIVVKDPCTCSIADLDGDYTVNYGDLDILAMYWLEDEPLADIFPATHDEIVNIRDFSKVAEDWNKDCRLADPKVTAIMSDPPQPYILPGQTGKDVNVEYHFKNRSDVKADYVRCLLYHDFNGQKSLVLDYHVQTVAPHQTITETHKFSGLAAGDHSFTVEIDPENTIEEADETNNIMTGYTSVIPPVTVSISANPSTGEIPLRMDFTATAAGGLPGYDYAWRIDGGMVRGLDTMSSIFSVDGTHLIELSVGDTRTPVDSTHEAYGWIFFDLQANSMSQPADLTVATPPQVSLLPGSSNAVEMRATVSNLQPVNVSAVRVKGIIRNEDDLSAPEIVFYDDLIAVAANGSTDIVAQTPNLPPANYSALAVVNLFSDNDPLPGAVPETDYENNQNLKDFTITGQDWFPFVVIDSISVEPEKPYVGTTAEVTAVVKNFNIYQRYVEAMFYYFDESNTKRRFAHSGIKAVAPGGSEVFTGRLWSLPRRDSVEVHVEIVAMHKFDEDYNQVIATKSMTFDVECFRFSVGSQLTLPLPDPDYRNDAVPFAVTAQVKNESEITGDVACYLKIDDIKLMSVPVHDIPPNSHKEVMFVLSWRGDKGALIRVGEMTVRGVLPKDIVDANGHDIVVGVESIKSGWPYAHLYFCGGTNSETETSVTILKGPVARIGDIVIEGQPTVGKTSYITCELTNIGGVDGYFDFAIRCHDIFNDTLVYSHRYWIQAGDAHTRNVRVPWTPGRAGEPVLEITCGEASYQLKDFVHPRLNNIQYGHAHGTSLSLNEKDEWVGDEEEDGPRLKYWLGAGGIADGDNARGYGIAYVQFEIDDGTSAANEWEVDLSFKGGSVGLINIANIGVAESDFEVACYVGLTDCTPDERLGKWEYKFSDECTGEPYCALPCRSRIWGFRAKSNVFESMAAGALGQLTFGISDAFLGVLDMVTCDIVVPCDKLKWEYRCVKLENGRRYRAFIALDGRLTAVDLGMVKADVYADFYYHWPDWCDNYSGVMEKRGIWIDNMTVRPIEVEWKGK
jgi:hypothetical protein